MMLLGKLALAETLSKPEGLLLMIVYWLMNLFFCQSFSGSLISKFHFGIPLFARICSMKN